MCKAEYSNLERCVLCGTLLNIPKDTHLVNRSNYIEGAGQLCEKCREEVYGKNVKHKHSGE